jgi:hypothetical protein
MTSAGLAHTGANLMRKPVAIARQRRRT